VRAVEDVSLRLAAGESLGLVGESGCGKSSLARSLVGLIRPRSGDIRFRGRSLLGLGERAWRRFRPRIQLVFQDPHASLDPRMSAGASIAEGLRIHGRLSRGEREARVAELLEQVGLPARRAGELPHTFSGGECQRLGLARALALDPELLLLDEPVSSLDVSVQARILELLASLREQRGFAALWIAHQMPVVRRMADRVAVMFAGRIVEAAPRDALFEEALHPYTRALLAAVPRPDPARPAPWGPVRAEPWLAAPQRGCPYRLRCPRASGRCAAELPGLAAHAPAHWVACHHPGADGGLSGR